MIRSMTGFGAGHGAAGAEALDVEIRSVNHKFCEVKVRLPRELSALEPDVVKLVKERLARGGVDVSARRAGPAGGARAARRRSPSRRPTRAPSTSCGRGSASPARPPSPTSLAADGRRPARRARARPGGGAGGAPLGASRPPLDALVAMRAREGEALARDLAAGSRSSRTSWRGSRSSCRRRSSITGPGSPSGCRSCRAASRLDPAPPRPGGRAVRGPDRRHRGDHAPAQPPRAGAGPPRRRRAGGPQARLPRPGDAPRGEHHRLEVAERGDRGRSSSPLKAEVERMREQVQNVE